MEETLTLKCSECGHNNEPERVYCHQCGAKLDRSNLPKPDEAKETNEAENTRRRVEKMMDVKSTSIGRTFRRLVNILLLASVVAAVALLLLPPGNAPAAIEDMGDYTVREWWDQQMDTPTPTQREYDEASVNLFLKTIRSPENASTEQKFKRAAVKFTPGVVTLFVEREIWGTQLWSSVDYHPVTVDGKFQMQVVGVRYGRLGIHPSVTYLHQFGVAPVLKVLERDFGKLDRVQEVRVEEGRLFIVTKP